LNVNKWDSSGFTRRIVEGMELLRAERCVLLEFPERDLKQWTIRVEGQLAGFIDRWGNGRFWVRPMGGGVVDYSSGGMDELKSAFARLEDAVAAVEFRKMVQDRCGVCDGMRQ
jgi:hypothetical protein